MRLNGRYVFVFKTLGINVFVGLYKIPGCMVSEPFKACGPMVKDIS